MKSERMGKVLALGAGMLVLAVAVQAQFWQKKGYQHWSQAECQKILSESPWANSYTIGKVILQTVSQESEDTAGLGRDTNPSVTYRARFLSARPIREAMVRLEQLKPKYKELSAEQKQAFEERARRFLENASPDTVVVQVVYAASPDMYDRQLARAWQSNAPEALKQTTFLNPGKVAPQEVSIGQGASRALQFVFPRKVDGKPVLGPEVKQAILEFEHPEAGVLAAERVVIKFDVKKMIANGQVVY